VSLFASIRQCQAFGSNRQDMGVRIGSARGLDGPVGSFFELTQSNVRESATRQHGKLKRIEGTQLARE
jgi:hypothetical protein